MDLLVYAPLGLALEARELLPKLAERGRGQVAVARLMSRFAMNRGQHEVARFLEAAVDGFSAGLRSDGGAQAADVTAERDIPVEPWPGYEGTTAAEIVRNLPARSAAERERVARFEAANRGRVTILNRVAELRSR